MSSTVSSAVSNAALADSLGAPASDSRGQLSVAVLGIGLLGPGLQSWAAGRALLCSPADWQYTPSVVPAPQRLPATERRRAGTVVRASIVVVYK